MYDEQLENDKFVKLAGGINAADRIQRIWNESYPTGGYMNQTPKEVVFVKSAVVAGFSKKAIKAFIQLR